MSTHIPRLSESAPNTRTAMASDLLSGAVPGSCGHVTRDTSSTRFAFLLRALARLVGFELPTYTVSTCKLCPLPPSIQCELSDGPSIGTIKPKGAIFIRPYR